MSQSGPGLPSPSFFDGPHGRIAYRETSGDGPCVIWLGGFRSDMDGTKAAHLHDWAAHTSRAYLRFDYSGHGLSDGVFEEGCISQWAADAAAIIDAKCDTPVILVGSSMGGWISLLYALRAPEKLAGLVLLAPAPDFTAALMWPSLSDEERETILRDGRLEQASAYSDAPTVLTRKLFDDGEKNLVLKDPMRIKAPVRILQGMADPDVPYAHALSVAEKIDTHDLTITLTKSGDHRLSSPQDLDRLVETLEAMLPYLNP